jgi:DNA-binding NarL/FixJ family response regulator
MAVTHKTNCMFTSPTPTIARLTQVRPEFVNTIAVLERHNGLRSALCQALEHLGYSVLWQADSPQQAMQLAETQPQPHILLVDPDVYAFNSYSFVYMIASIFRTLKIAVWTVDISLHRHSLTRAGAHVFIDKDGELAPLENGLQRLLDTHKTRKGDLVRHHEPAK